MNYRSPNVRLAMQVQRYQQDRARAERSLEKEREQSIIARTLITGYNIR